MAKKTLFFPYNGFIVLRIVVTLNFTKEYHTNKSDEKCHEYRPLVFCNVRGSFCVVPMCSDVTNSRERHRKKNRAHRMRNPKNSIQPFVRSISFNEICYLVSPARWHHSPTQTKTTTTFHFNLLPLENGEQTAEQQQQK